MEKDKVIIVDDDNMVLHALKREILSFPFSKKLELFFFDSPIRALEFIEANQNISLVITDQRMPQMSGYQLLAAVRKKSPEISSILISAYSDVDGIIKSIGSGIVAFIQKPWSSLHLMNEIKRGLELNKLKRLQRTYIVKLNKDLQINGQFQKSVMKHNIPNHRNLDFSVVTETLPPYYCGGDFYFVLKTDENCFVYLLGNAGGSGIKASGITLIIHSILKEYTDSNEDQRNLTPSDLMQYLNERIYRHLGNMVPGGIQCTALLFDLNFMNLTAVCAGNLKQYILRNPAMISIRGEGPALGIDTGHQYEETMTELQNKDRIIMYTEGLDQIQNDYGSLQSSFISFRNEDNFSNVIIDELKSNLKGKPINVDLSLLSVKINKQ